MLLPDVKPRMGLSRIKADIAQVFSGLGVRLSVLFVDKKRNYLRFDGVGLGTDPPDAGSYVVGYE